MARPPRRPIPTKPSAAAGNIHLSPPEFAFAATRVATAQIIQSAGFTSVQRSALDTLTELAGKYLSAVSSSAASAATSDGRTEANVCDIVVALEDVGSVQGFIGASNLNRRVLSSSVVTDLSRFVDYSLEIPFYQAFPRHPSPPRRILGQVLTGAGYRHIPSWLPGFPDIKLEKKEIKKREEGLFGCLYSEETTFFNEESRVLVGEKTSIDMPKKRARVWNIIEGNMMVLFDDKTSIDMPKKRARVRFKVGLRERVFGVGSRNGVCKGGKRVFCENSTKDENVNNDRGKNMMTMKCDSGLNRSEKCGNGGLNAPLQYYTRRRQL